MEAHLDAEAIERLEEQRGLLLRLYQADFAKDPTSRATQSSRSNLIALRHTINQIYGEAAALERLTPSQVAEELEKQFSSRGSEASGDNLDTGSLFAF